METIHTSIDLGFQYPFGEESCEHELAVLQDRYPEYFYEQSRFNQEALDPDVYLIVGRRGSGKTSLTQYFNFQKRFRNAHSIDVDEPEIYQSILQKIANSAYLSPDLAVNDVRKIWEYLIWSIIFSEYADLDGTINDGGSLMESYLAEGHDNHLTRADIERIIREAGRTPVERDTLYRPVQRRQDAGGPRQAPRPLPVVACKSYFGNLGAGGGLVPPPALSQPSPRER